MAAGTSARSSEQVCHKTVMPTPYASVPRSELSADYRLRELQALGGLDCNMMSNLIAPKKVCKDEILVCLLTNQVVAVGLCSVSLRLLCQSRDLRHFETITEQDREVDRLTRELLASLPRARMAPFERREIKDIVLLADDALSGIKRAASLIRLPEARQLDRTLHGMADVLCGCADLAREAVAMLGAPAARGRGIDSIAAEASLLKEELGEIYDFGIEQLYETGARTGLAVLSIGTGAYRSLDEAASGLIRMVDRIYAVMAGYVWPVAEEYPCCSNDQIQG